MKKVNFHDFTSKEAQQLLHNKFVVVIGDSSKYRNDFPTEPPVPKAIREYRQNVERLFQALDEVLPASTLVIWNTAMAITKDARCYIIEHERCFAGDTRVEVNKSSGNDYRLVRQYRTRHHLVRFYFITRAYSSYVDSILSDFRAAVEVDLVPDVVLVHSCLWDLNSWQSCKVSAEDMIEANFYSSILAQGFWFDTLDLHYHFRFLQDLHAVDGMHWNARAHRYLTKLLLTHLADAWQVELKKQPLLGKWGRRSLMCKNIYCHFSNYQQLFSA
ncbi:PREDICTED: PC-esterase domain-containing protein 1A-like [Thamnophis sirtalis]|uniref:PC-esterase domain-containing protein 1A-like n=1 Tax=Thamnophis sirtalis TaxID=35019 RepID=A0A6I9XRZ5_9SAUR|nr:PREDICTED: PC-esterase domain-containing protein 1A-like [Thamnophis sirtalis]